MCKSNEVCLSEYYQSVLNEKNETPARMLRLASDCKGKRGSYWGELCAAVVMIGVVCTGSVKEGLNLNRVFNGITEQSNRNAENYIFSADRVFTRTVPARMSLIPEYQRVLAGCTPEDSVESFVVHLYRFVEPNRRQRFRKAAERGFNVQIPVDAIVAC